MGVEPIVGTVGTLSLLCCFSGALSWMGSQVGHFYSARGGVSDVRGLVTVIIWERLEGELPSETLLGLGVLIKLTEAEQSWYIKLDIASTCGAFLPVMYWANSQHRFLLSKNPILPIQLASIVSTWAGCIHKGSRTENTHVLFVRRVFSLIRWWWNKLNVV